MKWVNFIIINHCEDSLLTLAFLFVYKDSFSLFVSDIFLSENHLEIR